MDLPVLAITLLAAFIATGVAIGALGLLTQVATRSSLSLFPLLYPMVLAYTGVSTLTSTRDFTSIWVAAQELERAPIAIWATRTASLVLLTGALIEVLRFLSGRGNERAPVLGLLVAFSAFALASSTATSLFSAHPYFHYTLLYTPIFCLGAICLRDADALTALLRARDASLAFLAIGWLLVPLVPKLVLNTSYAGLISGLPRFAGLATHEVSMASMTNIFMAILLAFPYSSRKMNVFAWGVALATLLLAQSKNAWATSLVIYVVFIYYDRTIQSKGRDPAERQGLVVGILCALFIIAALSLMALLFFDLPHRLDMFFNTRDGSNLLTFTGRDVIWEAAFDAWHANPWFGYGIALFGPEHRAQIGMLYATSGHNQIFDLLGRSGLFGLLGFLFLFVEMWRRSIGNALPSGGLSLVLIVALTGRGVTEVPISSGLFGYELLPFLLLLIVISRSPALNLAEYRQSVLQYRRSSNAKPILDTV